MTTKRKTIIAALLSGGGLLFIIWSLFSSGSKKEIRDIGNNQPSKENESSQEKKSGRVIDTVSKEERNKANIEWKKRIWSQAFKSPINFWGKVVDQDGKPIDEAKIEITVYSDSSWNFEGGNNPKYVKMSNSNGFFSLLGEKGSSINISASAKGYDTMNDIKTGIGLSRASIRYDGRDDNLRHKRPTKNNPTILVLRKKNPIANLEHIKRDYNISKNGNLEVLKIGETGLSIEVRCWSSVSSPFTYDKYDWRMELCVTGGKLKSLIETNPVEAPESNYTPYELKINMPTSLEKKWRSSFYNKHVFWYLTDKGYYGKLKLDVTTGRKHRVSVEAWHNLNGTRNFEQ